MLKFILICAAALIAYLVIRAIIRSRKVNSNMGKSVPSYVKSTYEKISINSRDLEKNLSDEERENCKLLGQIVSVDGPLKKLYCGAIAPDPFAFVLFDNYLVSEKFCIRLSDYQEIKCNIDKVDKVLRDLKKVEVADTSQQKSVVGSAVAGGILFGGVGAVVGAVAAADNNARHANDTKTELQYGDVICEYKAERATISLGGCFDDKQNGTIVLESLHRLEGNEYKYITEQEIKSVFKSAGSIGRYDN